MALRLFLLLSVLCCIASAQEPDTVKEQRMQWFADAKLGIFIHWGIYAVNGIDESWSFYNGKISYDDYMKQLNGFTAAKYDPGAWARLFQESGARYAVLTSKHHDGVALWNTRQSDLNVVKKTPAGRDLITPYCDALRKQGLRVGLYFSHLDWSHPDYPFLPGRRSDMRRIPHAGNGSWPFSAVRSRRSSTRSGPTCSGLTVIGIFPQNNGGQKRCGRR
jgi:alpha-L-fucosidase